MAAADLLSLTETASYLGIAQKTKTDTEIQTFITATSLRVDEICGPNVIRTVTNEAHDGGATVIKLDHAPVSTFTTVTEYSGTTATVLTAESNSSQPANSYLWDTRTELLYRRANGGDWFFPAGRRNIVLTYQAGRVADTASVTSQFKEAALIIVAHLWRTERGAGTMTFGEDGGLVPGFGFAIPRRAMELLADQVRGPVIV